MLAGGTQRGVVSPVVSASPADGVKEMESSRRRPACYPTSYTFDSSVPRCVITVVIRVVIVAILLYFIPFLR